VKLIELEFFCFLIKDEGAVNAPSFSIYG